MDAFQYAKTFLDLGFSIIPLKYKEKVPMIAWSKYQSVQPSKQEILSWFICPANYGVVTGYNRLVVIDFDNFGEYARWQIWCMKRGGIAGFVNSIAYRVRTFRGVHVYIRLPKDDRSRKLPGMDIKGQGGYVVGPGSVHPSGTVYIEMGKLWSIPPVEALSDVLPTELLTSAVLPLHVATPFKLAANPNLWVSPNPTKAPSAGLIAKLRKQFKIEDFFPDAKPSSKDGRWMMACCPFHDDQHASLWLDTERQICNCYSCGGLPMDVINLFGRLYGLDNKEAIRELAKRA